MNELATQVSDLVRLLVSRPDEVSARLREDRDTTVVELRVAQDDVGKVIGRRGQTIKALRLLLDLRGEVEDRDIELDLIEDAVGDRRRDED
jgi:predicted RNA-binding protein YlqC (UPF0109 family)